MLLYLHYQVNLMMNGKNQKQLIFKSQAPIGILAVWLLRNKRERESKWKLCEMVSWELFLFPRMKTNDSIIQMLASLKKWKLKNNILSNQFQGMFPEMVFENMLLNMSFLYYFHISVFWNIKQFHFLYQTNIKFSLITPKKTFNSTELL